MTLPPALQQAFDQYRARFMALSQRERIIVAGGGTLLLLVVIYLAVIEPVIKLRSSRIEALSSSRAIATQLEAASAIVMSARSGGATQGGGQSLMAAVDASTRSGVLGKAPERLQPEGEHEVKVWFDDVPFDNLSRWLAQLQQSYGIKVQSLEAESQAEPGAVDVRLSLTRG